MGLLGVLMYFGCSGDGTTTQTIGVDPIPPTGPQTVFGRVFLQPLVVVTDDASAADRAGPELQQLPPGRRQPLPAGDRLAGHREQHGPASGHHHPDHHGPALFTDGPSAFTLSPNGAALQGVFFNCSTQQSFTSTIRASWSRQ